MAPREQKSKVSWAGTARYIRYETVSPAAVTKKKVFPRDGMGKVSRLFTVRWKLDGKVGSHLVDGMGWDYKISWWDGTERKTVPGRQQVGSIFGESVGNIVGKSVGNIVGNTFWKRSREWL